MFMHRLHAPFEYGALGLHTAQLPDKNGVEAVQVLFGPFYACASHGRGEALLVDGDGVFYQREVDVG